MIAQLRSEGQLSCCVCDLLRPNGDKRRLLTQRRPGMPMVFNLLTGVVDPQKIQGWSSLRIRQTRSTRFLLVGRFFAHQRLCRSIGGGQGVSRVE